MYKVKINTISGNPHEGIVFVGSMKINLATADQAQLKVLFEAGHPFVEKVEATAKAAK